MTQYEKSDVVFILTEFLGIPFEKTTTPECSLSHECDLTFQLIFAQNCTMFLIFPWHKKSLLACVSVCSYLYNQ